VEQPAGSETADPGAAGPGAAAPGAAAPGAADPQAVERPAADAGPPPPPVIDPQESDPKPRSLYKRMKLFFFRTTLGRTRRDKSDI